MKLEMLGTVALITPMDAEERQWISDNVDFESWQWYAGSLAVEPRLAQDIVDAHKRSLTTSFRCGNIREKERETVKTYMAIDQHGQTYHGLQHPRKDLLARLGRKHAEKMYVCTCDEDLKTGGYRHSGYVIGQLWLTVYKVEPFKPTIE